MAVIILKKAGDVDFRSGLVSGPEWLEHKIRARFKFFRGEWFLNQLEGIDYYREVLRKGAEQEAVRFTLRKVLETCPGVQSVDRFDVAAGVNARELVVDWEVTSDDGNTVRGKEAFVI